MTRPILLMMLATCSPAAQAQPASIQPSVDTAEQRQALRSLTDCVAKARPNWARQMLAQPYLGEAQTRSAGEALSGKDRCLVGDGTEIVFRTSSMVSSLAEYFIRPDLTNANLDRVSRALNTIAPLNASEDFALCVAARDPAAARDLALSEPGGKDELEAAGKLVPQIKPCVIKGEQPTVDLQSLRGLMSIALYRAVTTSALAQN